MSRHRNWAITRIRLINFHNFVDETITIPGRGHLFLLGDNGCGKTTVLDAVHFVLTAGRAMEWNSAARVTGRRSDGRRLQGVILRYNIETGVINRQGAISYAALELQDEGGRLLTLGLGMTVRSLEEKVDIWGVIRECPLEEVPFLVEDEQGRRPASRRELKNLLGKRRGWYRDPTSYRRELAGRLFGGADTYREICRFLSMGKAYREIAAGAADYHELFKQLLPEPHTTVFEDIITGLRGIDEARGLLEELEEKSAYLREVQDLVDRVEHRREAVCRYDWLLCRWRLRDNEQALAREKDGQERLGQARQEAGTALDALQRTGEMLQERLADLKSRDASGLVQREKQRRNELAGKEKELQEAAAELRRKRARSGKAVRLEKKADRELRGLLARLIDRCGRATRVLPFSIAGLQQRADEQYHDPDPDRCGRLEDGKLFARLDKHLADGAGRLALLRQEEEQGAARRDELESALARARQREEPGPGEAAAACAQAMRNAMLSPRPLYLGLEWRPGLSTAEQDRIEEAIGREVLVTLLVEDGEYDQARPIAAEHPGVRISCRARGAEELPEWMRQVFDIRTSQPAALRCLAAEMESGREPVVHRLQGRDMLAFRSHERALTGRSASLVGQERRRRAWQEEIDTLAREVTRAGKEVARLERQRRREEKNLTLLNRHKEALAALLVDIRAQASRLASARQELDHCRESEQRLRNRHDRLQAEAGELRDHCRQLAEQIAAQGLAGLEKKVRGLQRKVERNQKGISEREREIGAIDARLDQTDREQERFEQHGQELTRRLGEAEAVLAARLPEVDDLARYVLKTKTGHQFASIEAVLDKRARAEDNIRELVPEIRLKIRDPRFGAAFRFTHEGETNKVFDFRARPLAEVLAEQERAVREQQELLGDKTRELFRRIIMTDLMNYLRSHVGSLEEMVRFINRQLGKRSFGGQKYRFRVRPLPRFARLVEVIKKFSPFDPEAEEEIRGFFEDHQEEIMNAETGAVPEELDYRNWYRYELEVVTLGDAGVVIDRSTKSMGSGGEQAVPNYLLVLTIAHFLYRGKKVRLHTLLFDEAFYGIDAGRRDQLLGFATDLDLQLLVASPDQDGVRREINHSTTLFVVKDREFNVHLRDFHWRNPDLVRQRTLFDQPGEEQPIAFGKEL